MDTDEALHHLCHRFSGAYEKRDSEKNRKRTRQGFTSLTPQFQWRVSWEREEEAGGEVGKTMVSRSDLQCGEGGDIELSTTAWLTDGLSLLRDGQETLSNILHLPHSQESPQPPRVLRESSPFRRRLRHLPHVGPLPPRAPVRRSSRSPEKRRRQNLLLRKISPRSRARRREADVIYTRAEDEYNHCHVDVLNGSYGEAELASVIEVTVLVSVVLFNGIYLSLRSSKTIAFVGFLKRSVREERQEL
ncbi:unnamed protein product [Brassica napus]|uniref:(rape) hypothetical protein n=1 Tax=Brassica napus TaxID=3708 RepID=A0A817B7X0_BRANA|nr:unnamed protein product [Brassica napus]